MPLSETVVGQGQGRIALPQFRRLSSICIWGGFEGERRRFLPSEEACRGNWVGRREECERRDVAEPSPRLCVVLILLTLYCLDAMSRSGSGTWCGKSNPQSALSWKSHDSNATFSQMDSEIQPQEVSRKAKRR